METYNPYKVYSQEYRISWKRKSQKALYRAVNWDDTWVAFRDHEKIGQGTFMEVTDIIENHIKEDNIDDNQKTL